MTTQTTGGDVNATSLRFNPSPGRRTHAGTAKDGRNVPASPPVTPCYGKWALFDSTKPEDHAEARALCLDCPILEDCRIRLNRILRNVASYGAPDGTWAGRGFGIREITPEMRAAEDARYSKRDAQLAHKQFAKGLRSEWINTGERVYRRNQKRAQRRAQHARRKAA